MVSKCANPACKTEFKYFRDGRLFEFEHAGGLSAVPGRLHKAPKHRTLYWLCKRCAADYTLACHGTSVDLVPTHQHKRHHAA